jgi:AcrR family transcriptional regulator
MKDEPEELCVISRRSPGYADRKVTRRKFRAQGFRTRRMIVRAATKLLLQSGGSGFTLRAVSRESKISVSNLQYYFPERQELLRAVMAPIIEAYLTDLDRALNSKIAPREMLEALAERALRDAKDARLMALMWHFASLTRIDPECSRLFEEWYEALVRGVAQLVKRINPDLGSTGSIQLARLLIAMANGLGFQMQAGRERKHTCDFDAAFLTMVEFLLHRNPLMGRQAAIKVSAK